MVSWLDPDLESEKHRTGYVTLYIDYPQGRHHVERGYRNNALELSRLDSLLLPLRGDGPLHDPPSRGLWLCLPRGCLL